MRTVCTKFQWLCSKHAVKVLSYLYQLNSRLLKTSLLNLVTIIYKVKCRSYFNNVSYCSTQIASFGLPNMVTPDFGRSLTPISTGGYETITSIVNQSYGKLHHCAVHSTNSKVFWTDFRQLFSQCTFSSVSTTILSLCKRLKTPKPDLH